MSKQEFKCIWCKITEHQGQLFYTKKGLPFKYSVKGNSLKTTRTEFNLSKKDFETVWQKMPIKRLTDIQNIVRGPSYIYAILTDARVNDGN